MTKAQLNRKITKIVNDNLKSKGLKTNEASQRELWQMKYEVALKLLTKEI